MEAIHFVFLFGEEPQCGYLNKSKWWLQTRQPPRTLAETLSVGVRITGLHSWPSPDLLWE